MVKNSWWLAGNLSALSRGAMNIPEEVQKLKQTFSGALNLDAQQRRLRLEMNGGFISVMYRNDDQKYKNPTAEQLHPKLTSISTWWQVVVYLKVSSILEAVFRWLGAHKKNDIGSVGQAEMVCSPPFPGQQRVHLALCGVDELLSLMDDLPHNESFLSHVQQAAGVLVSADTEPDLQIETGLLIAKYSGQMKKDLEARISFLQKPPSCFSSLLAPIVQRIPLGPYLQSTIPATDFGPQLDLLTGHGFLSDEKSNKTRVQGFMQQYDSGQGLFYSHPIAKYMFDTSGDMRAMLDLYVSEDDITLQSLDMRPVVELLTEWFLITPMSTQEIEGVHGCMSNAVGINQNITIAKLSARVCRTLNGLAPKNVYLLSMNDKNSAKEVKTYCSAQQKAERHRDHSDFYEFWQTQTVYPVPVVTPEDKNIWLSRSPVAARHVGPDVGIVEKQKRIRKLLVTIFPIGHWFGVHRESSQEPASNADTAGTLLSCCVPHGSDNMFHFTTVFNIANSDKDGDFVLSTVDSDSWKVNVKLLKDQDLQFTLGDLLSDNGLVGLDSVFHLQLEVVGRKISTFTSAVKLYEWRVGVLQGDSVGVTDDKKRDADGFDGDRPAEYESIDLKCASHEELAWMACSKWRKSVENSDGFFFLVKLRKLVLAKFWQVGQLRHSGQKRKKGIKRKVTASAQDAEQSAVSGEEDDADSVTSSQEFADSSDSDVERKLDGPSESDEDRDMELSKTARPKLFAFVNGVEETLNTSVTSVDRLSVRWHDGRSFEIKRGSVVQYFFKTKKGEESQYLAVDAIHRQRCGTKTGSVYSNRFVVWGFDLWLFRQAFETGWRPDGSEVSLVGIKSWKDLDQTQRHRLKRLGLVFDATLTPLNNVHMSIPPGQREVDVQKIRKRIAVYSSLSGADQSGDPSARCVSFAINSGDNFSDRVDFDFRQKVEFADEAQPDSPRLRRSRLKKAGQK